MPVAGFDKGIRRRVAPLGHIRGEVAVIVEVREVDSFEGAHDGEIVSRIEPPGRSAAVQPIENGAV
jgi:hypothetical protein